MGGRGAYLQKGGFSYQEYEATGETINGIKVIKHKTRPNASLPEMSNTPGAVYILHNPVGYKQLGIYGKDRRLKKTIEFMHGHKQKINGKKVHLKRGVVHVHNHKGGRSNNVRYINKREIKKYGSVLSKMGGVIVEWNLRDYK